MGSSAYENGSESSASGRVAEGLSDCGGQDKKRAACALHSAGR